jgi:hypothetical protein
MVCAGVEDTWAVAAATAVVAADAEVPRQRTERLPVAARAVAVARTVWIDRRFMVR